MTLTLAKRAHLVQDIKDALMKYWADIPANNMPRRPIWLQCKAGNLYVRGSANHMVDGEYHSCFDFANVNVHPKYLGNGIVTEVIEWWHTQHTQSYTYIESIQNDEFYARLVKRGYVPQPYTCLAKATN